MYLLGVLLAALLLGGCQGDTLPPAPPAELSPARAVAMVYRTHAAAGETPCFRAPDADSAVTLRLRNGQLVDLASPDDGLTQQGTEYWLHVYPRPGHRPACYINVRNLIPDS